MTCRSRPAARSTAGRFWSWPEAPRQRTLKAVTAPRTPEEELLSGLWAEVLDLEASGVDVESDFFESGGHSLTATRLAALVRQTFGVELPLKEIFARRTLAALAARLPGLRRQGQVLDPPRPTERSAPLPLSFAQERLWILDRLEGGSPAYNMPGAFRLTGELEVTAPRAGLRRDRSPPRGSAHPLRRDRRRGEPGHRRSRFPPRRR